MKLLAILILFVEAVQARGRVALVTSDMADNREMWWKNTRNANMREVRERRRMKNIPGQFIDTRGSDTDTDTTREGLQCLQEELLLCTDQLTSTLKRCKIFAWPCRKKMPLSPKKSYKIFLIFQLIRNERGFVTTEQGLDKLCRLSARILYSPWGKSRKSFKMRNGSPPFSGKS